MGGILRTSYNHVLLVRINTTKKISNTTDNHPTLTYFACCNSDPWEPVRVGDLPAAEAAADFIAARTMLLGPKKLSKRKKMNNQNSRNRNGGKFFVGLRAGRWGAIVLIINKYTKEKIYEHIPPFFLNRCRFLDHFTIPEERRKK